MLFLFSLLFVYDDRFSRFPVSCFSIPSFSKFYGYIFAPCVQAQLMPPTPQFFPCQVSVYAYPEVRTDEYVRADSFRAVSPKRVVRWTILNLKQSVAPHNMSKGASLTDETRKSVFHVDPPLLFLNDKMVRKDQMNGSAEFNNLALLS